MPLPGDIPMTSSGFCVFGTPIGFCGLAWTGQGLVAGLQLPEGSETQTRARLTRRFPQARETASPPAELRPAVEAIVGLLRGEPADLSSIALDFARVPPFHGRVYRVARTIPCGATLTYGEVAARLGDRGLARAVGQALGKNPFPIIVPCHRVVAADSFGGFSAYGGASMKCRLLAIEGAPAAGTPGLFDWLPASEAGRAQLP